MARWLLSFEAIDPKTLSGRWTVGIPERLYRLYQKQGHEKAIARIVLVDEVLGSGTVRIYKGWSRPGKEESFVYEGYPLHDHKSLSISTPAPPNMAFLVFIFPDGTIDEWAWRPLSQDGENQVDGIRGELIWSKNPK